MEHNMILSASGWRKIFTETGDSEDVSPDIGMENRELCVLIAEAFAQYLPAQTGQQTPTIVVGRDSRPTGEEIADTILRALISRDIPVQYLGIAAAPEIMAYTAAAQEADAFIYISASHNPIGYNGIKFGLNDGGVLEGAEVKKLAAIFEEKCAEDGADKRADELIFSVSDEALKAIYDESWTYKKKALQAYERFIRVIITGADDEASQQKVFTAMQSSMVQSPLTILCDMNGSARIESIDKSFIPGRGMTFLPFNNKAGHIAHGIIPEGENLQYSVDIMQDLQQDGNKDVILGYMPDCDGDRGNIVFWNDKTQSAEAIPAQAVFALCVLAESAFDCWRTQNLPKTSLLWMAEHKYGKKAVIVNGPTSMRIDAICEAFGIEVFRAEVGEANVVNLAREKSRAGYSVRIFGEGSNGGNITVPSKVRDPLASVFAILKLLTLRDHTNEDGSLSKGLFHIWCEKSKQEFRYHDDFHLADILDTLPAYTTTAVSEQRAMLEIKTQDKGLLKERFQQVFMEEWESHKDELQNIYGFTGYEADTTNGTTELRGTTTWNNGTGGLKIRFFNESGKTIAFIWMRPSGTEPVFRILCDVEGAEDAAERSLLRWETSMIRKADQEAAG